MNPPAMQEMNNEKSYLLKTSSAVRAEISPIVIRLLETLDQIFQTDRTFHDHIYIEIPKGALHWDSTEIYPNKDWGAVTLRISANRTLAVAIIPLREVSDLAEVEVVETLWDAENTSSAYEIRNCSLSLMEARQLLVCLVAGFYPWSISIRTIE